MKRSSIFSVLIFHVEDKRTEMAIVLRVNKTVLLQHLRPKNWTIFKMFLNIKMVTPNM